MFTRPNGFSQTARLLFVPLIAATTLLVLLASDVSAWDCNQNGIPDDQEQETHGYTGRPEVCEFRGRFFAVSDRIPFLTDPVSLDARGLNYHRAYGGVEFETLTSGYEDWNAEIIHPDPVTGHFYTVVGSHFLRYFGTASWSYYVGGTGLPPMKPAGHGIALRTETGEFYGFAAINLYENEWGFGPVGRTVGRVTVPVPITVVGGGTLGVNRLAYHDARQKFYTWADNGDFHSIDPDTGTAQFIGTTSIPPGSEAFLTYAPDSNILYGQIGDNYYRLQPATAALVSLPIEPTVETNLYTSRNTTTNRNFLTWKAADLTDESISVVSSGAGLLTNVIQSTGSAKWPLLEDTIPPLDTAAFHYELFSPPPFSTLIPTVVGRAGDTVVLVRVYATYFNVSVVQPLNTPGGFELEGQLVYDGASQRVLSRGRSGSQQAIFEIDAFDGTVTMTEDEVWPPGFPYYNTLTGELEFLDVPGVEILGVNRRDRSYSVLDRSVGTIYTFDWTTGQRTLFGRMHVERFSLHTFDYHRQLLVGFGETPTGSRYLEIDPKSSEVLRDEPVNEVCNLSYHTPSGITYCQSGDTLWKLDLSTLEREFVLAFDHPQETGVISPTGDAYYSISHFDESGADHAGQDDSGWLVRTDVATGQSTYVGQLRGDANGPMALEFANETLYALSGPLALLGTVDLETAEVSNIGHMPYVSAGENGVRGLTFMVGDCNANEISDWQEAQIQGNVIDHIPDDCGKDCNSNGLRDDKEGYAVGDCDFAFASECQNDCNGNFIADSCEIAPAGEAGRPKNRYLSLDLTQSPATSVAIRITLLDSEIAPELAGTERYVGTLGSYFESSENSPPFAAAALQCEPRYADWTGDGPINVFGPAVIPQSTYQVELVPEFGGGPALPCPVVLRTDLWGDVIAPRNNALQNDDQPNLGDILAVVDQFLGLPTAPGKAAASMRAEAIDPAFPVALQDILGTVDAFLAVPYPVAYLPDPNACGP